MCGSLLSKFKKNSNKVNPVFNTDSLEPKRVKRKTNLVDGTSSVDGNTSNSVGEIILVREMSTAVRPPDLSRENFSEVTPTGNTKAAIEENTERSVLLYSSALGSEQRKTQPDFEYAGVQDPGSVVECDFKTDARATESTDSVGPEQAKAGQGSGSVAVWTPNTEAQVMERAGSAGSERSDYAAECDFTLEKRATESTYSVAPEQNNAEQGSGSVAACEIKTQTQAMERAGSAGSDLSNYAAECKPTAEKRATEITYSADLEQKKGGRDSEYVAECEFKTNVRIIESAGSDGPKQKKAEPVSKPVAEHESKNAISFSIAEFKSIKAEAQTIESVGSADHEQEKAYSVTGTAADCESKNEVRAVDSVDPSDSKQKKTEIEFRSAADCECKTVLQALESASFARPEQNKTDPVAAEYEPNTEGLTFRSAGSTQKKTELDPRPPAECKSTAKAPALERVVYAGPEQKKSDPDTGTAAECESKSDEMQPLESDGSAVSGQNKTVLDFGSADEFGSRTKARAIKSISFAALQQKKTEPHSKSSPQYKATAEARSTSSSLEQNKVEPDSESVAEFESNADVQIIEIAGTSIPEQKKSEPDSRSTAEFESKDDAQPIVNAVSELTLERPEDYSFPFPAGQIKVRLEGKITHKSDVPSRSENTLSCISVNQGELIAGQGGPCSGHAKTKAQPANQRASTAIDKREEKLASVQDSPGCHSTIKIDVAAELPSGNRQILHKKITKEHSREKTTTVDKNVTDSHSGSQSLACPVLLSRNREVLLAMARKELEERVIQVGNRPSPG